MATVDAKPSLERVEAKPSFIRNIAETRNVETIKKAIKAKYGFTPTDEYARDLIAFVEDMTLGQRR